MQFLSRSNTANVQSPGSQSSKGSSSLDQEYLPATTMPDVLTNFITNNYGDNYYVADQDGTSASVDELGLDDIDEEIDTKNMAIYSGASKKKERRTGSGTSQQQLKKEPTDTESKSVPETSRKSQSIGESLLIPSESINDSLEMDNAIDADLMLNALNEQPSGSDLMEGNMENQMMDPLVNQNTIFDESSQVSF